MRRILSIILVVMCATASLWALGTSRGVTTKKATYPQTIHTLEASTGVNVAYTFDPSATQTYVEIYGASDIIDYLHADVKNGKLKAYIKTDKRHVRITNAKITVRSGALKSVETSSGANVKIVNAMTSKGNVDVEASSGSNFSAPQGIICNKLDVECSSGSKIALKTTCARADIEVSSGSKVTVSGRVTEKAKIEASSASEANVQHLSAPRAIIEASSAAVVTHSFRNAEIDKSSAAKVRKK